MLGRVEEGESMEMTVVFLSILGALLVGTLSPGPSFVLVARVAVAQSRPEGLAAALGMGLGGVVYGGLALLGLHILLAQVGWLYFGLKLLGGAYLLYLGYRLWRGAGEALVLETPGTAAAPRARGAFRALVLGLTTQLSNPKTAIVYSSIFAAFLPTDVPFLFAALLLATILLLETGWYAIVALAFSARGPRARYLRARIWLDRLAGSVMGLLGIRLIGDT